MSKEKPNEKICTTECIEAMQHNNEWHCKLKYQTTPQSSSKLTFGECGYLRIKK